MATLQDVSRTLIPRGARNWLRAPSVSARWAWDEFKFNLGVRKVIEMRPGWWLTCHPAAYRCAYVAQVSDPEQVAEFEAFIRHTSPGMVLFDVGAHFGLFSLAALHYGGPSARAIAVDPSPVAIRFQGIQAALNNAERLQSIQASADDHSGCRNMLAVGVLANGYYVSAPQSYPANELSKTTAVTLDEMVDKVGVRPTHIKIDVEGHEAAVLRGGRKTLSQDPAPLLFLELHNEMISAQGGQPEETLALLKEYGYLTFDSEDVLVGDTEISAKPLVRIVARRLATYTKAASR
ncbi:MAG TPA: FkbM family methyltransferase [Pyrinomonadaceae bacterium]|nr:FkbM family methyltransferase [Pyrinomonadaceae bacterium]